MKTLVKGLALFAMMAVAGQASATIIQDKYYGADGFSSLSDRDVIGDKNRYEINNMDVNFDSKYMSVRINTNFTNVGDPYKVDFGDLFISIDGWKPYGSAPYTSDNIFTGEKWEFVFDTSGGMLYGGDFKILTSDKFFGGSGLYYRKNQEVQYGGGGTEYTGSSVDLSHAGYGGYVEYKILLASLGISGDVSLGFKWGMTCANDSIEGGLRTTVPEPTSLLILALGLLGLGVATRKRA